ncbi:hypothetical protein H5410_063891 [Solanum commersonii]|uniref:Uncharacterized protein n=1 Tax=Solanum commersonii TaxID=4109 RepID=A0A9J5WF68_SOLCO|nr:hypothetical protein H5410_063891 [Solanum commersonii]
MMKNFLQVNSEHPLAEVIAGYAKKFREHEKNSEWAEVREFESISSQDLIPVDVEAFAKTEQLTQIAYARDPAGGAIIYLV